MRQARRARRRIATKRLAEIPADPEGSGPAGFRPLKAHWACDVRRSLGSMTSREFKVATTTRLVSRVLTARTAASSVSVAQLWSRLQSDLGRRIPGKGLR